MDPGRPLLLPSEGRGQRIPELLLGARDALDELDGPAVLDVHGGQQLQCFHDANPTVKPACGTESHQQGLKRGRS